MLKSKVFGVRRNYRELNSYKYPPTLIQKPFKLREHGYNLLHSNVSIVLDSQG